MLSVHGQERIRTAKNNFCLLPPAPSDSKTISHWGEIRSKFFYFNCSIFIEHFEEVWYNYNRPKKGSLAENRLS